MKKPKKPPLWIGVILMTASPIIGYSLYHQGMNDAYRALESNQPGPPGLNQGISTTLYGTALGAIGCIAGLTLVIYSLIRAREKPQEATTGSTTAS